MSSVDYNKAHRQALLDRTELEVLNEKETETLPHIFLGIMEIPLDLIVGVVNASRGEAFSGGWMPQLKDTTEFARKWSALYESQIEEGIREPVKAVEYMRKFYIIEGNKRVSVMKYLKAPSIIANVTRIVPEHKETPEILAYEEFMAFQKVTGIFEIGFSKPGSYRKLAEMLKRDLKTPWPSDASRELQGAFFRFSEVCRQVIKDESFNISDAFLTYLTIFTYDSVLDKNREVLKKRILRIRKEFFDEKKKLTTKKEAEQKNLLTMPLRLIPKYTERKPLRAGFLYAGKDLQDPRIAEHENSRIFLNHRFEGILQTKAYPGCTDDEQTEKIINKACRENDLLFTTDPSLLRVTLKAAADHPEVRFINRSVSRKAHTITTYDMRYDEICFITGILAGIIHHERQIFYFRDPDYRTFERVNAFAAGVSWIDPDAKIILTDEKPKRNAVIMDTRYMNKEAMTGLWLISEDGNGKNIASPVWNWQKYYELMLRDFLYEPLLVTEEVTGYWLGMHDEVTDLHLSSSLPEGIRKTINVFRTAILNGQLDPFADDDQVDHELPVSFMTNLVENILDEQDEDTPDQ